MEPVSVIITCFNLEKYIGETIQSVLDQDYAGPVEIILVDDCSTDRSPEIVAGFPEVSYVRTSANGGVLRAMIAGFRRASHDLVCLLDGDDLWMPDKISAVARAFAQNPRLVFVTHDIACVDAGGAPLPIPSRPAKRMPGIAPEKVSDVLRKTALEMGDFICLGSAMTIRRSLADLDSFIRFAEELPDPSNTYQDWPLVAWMSVLEGREFGYIPKVLYKYRIHGANHSGDASSVEKATRNLSRTYNSINAHIDIARFSGAGEPIIVGLLARRQSIQYLLDLTHGDFGAAARSFLRALPDLKRRGLVLKEAVRLAAVMVLGPRRFLRLSSNRRLFKFIPTT
jgi:glycosyltransferase involved in cell wall biosynthesis